MNIICGVLCRFILILVLVFGLLFFGIKVVWDICVDILLDMNFLVVYIVYVFNGYILE